MKVLALTMLAFLAIAQLMVEPSEAVTCSQVNGALTSCVPYLTGGGTPTSECCAGVTNVNSMTPTRADRQAACSCLQQSSASMGNIREDAATSLPQKCNVQVSVPIGRNTDCSSLA